MVVGRLIQGVADTTLNATGAVTDLFSEPTIRLGVTGLARAGKTVFITSLVANLLDRARMPGLLAQSEGRILSAYLQPQPDDTIPRFDFETHLRALTARSPSWPDSTRSISQLRLSMKVKPNGMLSGLQGPRTIHIDIIDYPGEWLLDLGLMDKSYTDWSRGVLERIENRSVAQDFLNDANQTNPADKHDEMLAKSLAESFTAYLHAARKEGFSDCTPGRFLMPGEMEGSPVLTFAPLPHPGDIPRKSLWREMERRFETYKAKVITPFFRDHFSKLDRQVVLVDVLGAIHSGPEAVEDMRLAMSDTLAAFRPGTNAFLAKLLLGKRVEKILFAATKSDHLHHLQHPQLTAIMEALTRDARDRARFAGADTSALSLAALRATTEETLPYQGSDLNCVRGILEETGKQAAFYPGALPDDPSHLLGPAASGAMQWLDQDYQVMRFAPAPLTLKPGEGPPHIRMDRAAEFLLGDRL